MIITISGMPGSGKSTVAKRVAEKLNLKHYSAGDFLRQIAKERGVPLAQLTEQAENDNGKIDRELDERTKQLGMKETDFVIDGRLAFHFIPQAIKIFLDVSPEVACERILRDVQAGRRTGEMAAGAKTLEEVREAIGERVRSENSRYQKYYGVQYTDLSHYDLIVETSHRAIESVVQDIVRFLKMHGDLVKR